jgi:uncharacterized protein (DUF4415 family)
MKSKIVSYTSTQLDALRKRGESKTDWARLRKMTDADIDFSDSPEISPERFAKAVAHKNLPGAKSKTQLTLRLDTDVVAWFRAQGPGYQTRINALLRAYREAHRK